MPEYVPAESLDDSTFVDRQPLPFAALVAAFVNAVTVALVAFGVHLTAEQSAAVLGLVNTAMALGGAVWAWRRVTPVRRIS